MVTCTEKKLSSEFTIRSLKERLVLNIYKDVDVQKFIEKGKRRVK